jgi:hypothetical protein
VSASDGWCRLFSADDSFASPLGISPSPFQLVIAMNALRKGGRHSEAVEIYLQKFVRTSQTESANGKVDKKSKNKVKKVEDASLDDIYHFALRCALASCAAGKLGNETLLLLSELKRRPNVSNTSFVSPGDEAKQSESAIISLATSDYIEYLPNLLDMIASFGPENRAVILNRRLFVAALAACAHVNDAAACSAVLKKLPEHGRLTL